MKLHAQYDIMVTNSWVLEKQFFHKQRNITQHHTLVMAEIISCLILIVWLLKYHMILAHIVPIILLKSG